MKFTKLGAVSATIALAVGSVFGAGLAASAVEVDVPIDEIGTVLDGQPYLEGQWFLGDPVGPELTQDTTGLTIPGQNQLLYGWSVEAVSGEQFADFILTTTVVATGPYTFQVPVFFDGEFTTLRPATAGTPTLDSEWISSRAAGGLLANTPYPAEEIAGAFDDAENAEILAFGIFVDEGSTAVLQSVTVFEDTWNFATPTAVVPPVTPPAVVPTPIQKPVTFTG